MVYLLLPTDSGNLQCKNSQQNLSEKSSSSSSLADKWESKIWEI